MKTIKFKNKLVENIDLLISSYPTDEFKSPYRSTIPLISLVANNGYFDSMVKDSEDLIEFIYEYETPVRKGVGFPSCTDLLIRTENKCIVIEAKRTEPKYETISEWLDGTENRDMVLSGWIEYIYKYTQELLPFDKIQALPYQLIHRTASACSLKVPNVEVLYIGFDLTSKMGEYYKSTLMELSSLLNGKIDLNLLEIGIVKTPLQINLEKEWDRGNRDLSNDVKNGLLNKKLMKF